VARCCAGARADSNDSEGAVAIRQHIIMQVSIFLEYIIRTFLIEG
jgi:hypothetical protein